MRTWQPLVAAFLCSLMLLLWQTAGAGEGPAADAAAKEKWREVYSKVAQSVTMRRGARELALQTAPLLFYTNPVRTNDQHGAIFLWTDEGRPAVIGSIWSALNRSDPTMRNVAHEWHSLLEDQDVSANRGNKTFWYSGEPGVAWGKLAELAPPAPARPGRLVQMRAIAQRYAVEIKAAEESDLQLKSQPLYRYPEKTAGVIDGAVFAFCMATDPELLVLVEARPQEQAAAWHVAFARFGNKPMTVKSGEQIVWSCEAGAPGMSDGKYYLRWRAEQMPAEPTPGPRPPTP